MASARGPRPRSYDAAPFVASALAGLAGRQLQHEESPEKVAARAVALGVATAEAFSAFVEKQNTEDR